MRGLALEGGASRGAYHIGVVKAYLEEGYTFDGFVGTSIGAINAAVLAQGDFDKALTLWSQLSMEHLFSADEQVLLKMAARTGDINALGHVRSGLRKIIDGGGVDTSRIRAIVGQCIDEQRIRASGKDFGLVTVSVTERKPYELLLEDIPPGKLLSFVMASACMPGFKSEVIDDKQYIDGAIYNNCPVNLLVQKGYDEIVAVRTLAPGIYRHFAIPAGVDVRTITPSGDLGSTLVFSPEIIGRNIQMGYLDALRLLQGLLGQRYFISPDDFVEPFPELASLSDQAIGEIGGLLGTVGRPAKRMLLERVIPILGTYLKLKRDFDYADFVLALLEYGARMCGVERLRVYGYREFMSVVREGLVKNKENTPVSPGMFSAKVPMLKHKNAALTLLWHFLATVKKV